MPYKPRNKLYQDLTIDEPLPHDPVLEAEVNAMTPELMKASIKSAWFANPGGHFRRRILKKLERAGVMRFIKAPDGREQMQFADDPRIPPNFNEVLSLSLISSKLLMAHSTIPRTRTEHALTTSRTARSHCLTLLPSNSGARRLRPSGSPNFAA